MRIIILLVLVMGSMFAAADTVAKFTLASGVDVKITESSFDKKLFKIDGCTESNEMCLINGHIPWGTDFNFPKTVLKSITASYQGKVYSLDVADMYNAWGNRPLEYKGSVRYFGGKCFDKNNCQFRGLFSDAAGSFVAEWRVINGLSLRTVLTDSNDIVNLFTEHIDPPEFE